MTKEKIPVLFNGGMGARISSPPLAWDVSSYNLLTPTIDHETFLQERPSTLIKSSHDTVGVVSGVALHLFMVRELQLGDRGGHLHRAFDHFPVPDIAERTWDKYYIQGGKPENQPFANIPMASMHPSKQLEEMAILANFSEVWLAKEGHDGYVGINYLDKIWSLNMASAFGALLAGPHYMCVGAGFPKQFPEILKKLAKYESTEYRPYVEKAGKNEDYHMTFNPTNHVPAGRVEIDPAILTLILAYPALIEREVDQYGDIIKAAIVEGPKAGGHLSPERPEKPFDLSKIGVPVYLAGGYGSPEGLVEAIDIHKAAGVSIASILALARGSGMIESLQQEIFRRYKNGTLEIVVNPTISPTGFRFRTVKGLGIENPEIAAGREKICDLGFLRHIAKIRDEQTNQERIEYYCPADPSHGEAGCMCNFLAATAGYGQIRKSGEVEPPGVTLGADVSFLDKLKFPYTVREALDYMLSGYRQRSAT